MASILPVRSIKEYAESATNLSSIPSSYAYNSSGINATASDACDPLLSDSVPIIDFSLLISPNPSQRSRAIHDLATACTDWGAFTLVNHGVPEEMITNMLNKANDFFNLTVEEKLEFHGNRILDPIRCGTSINPSVEKVFCWRDYLKVFTHPDFHFPHKPQGFSELAREYCGRVRDVSRWLLGGISESLGLEESYLESFLSWKSGYQVFIANLYPLCPQPEPAAGLPPHCDHGLMTVLAQNEVDGLQVHHNGVWVPVKGIPANSLLVIIGDQIEIVSNGRYKSSLHRATVNNKATRISLAVVNGPSLDATVYPAPDLVNNEDNRAMYRTTKYRDYLKVHQSKPPNGRSCIDSFRVISKLDS